MAYSGAHNPSERSQSRPNPDGWQGGPEDFETVWTLKGHVAVPLEDSDMTNWEAAKVSRNHNRLHDAPGFC